MLDFTNPETVKWYQEKLGNLIEMGVGDVYKRQAPLLAGNLFEAGMDGHGDAVPTVVGGHEGAAASLGDAFIERISAVSYTHLVLIMMSVIGRLRRLTIIRSRVIKMAMVKSTFTLRPTIK